MNLILVQLDMSRDTPKFWSQGEGVRYDATGCGSRHEKH